MDTSTPTPPPAPSPAPPPAHPSFNFDLNQRDKETMKWSAIWNAAAATVVYVANYAGGFFIGGLSGEMIKLGRALGTPDYYSRFDISAFIVAAFWGAVWGAVGGFILSRFYDTFKQWNIRYLKGKLNTLFKLLFYPTLVGALIGLLIGGMFSFAIGIMPILILVAGEVAARFLYAKMMAKNVGNLYQ